MVGLPSRRDRKKMFAKHLDGINHTLSKRDLCALAISTYGWSGSDIESLTREAVMAPVRECLRLSALHRRRRPREGDVLGVDDGLYVDAPSRDGTQVLIENLQRIRPVLRDDFENAMCVVSEGRRMARCTEYPFGDHYDSSSGDDDTSGDESI